MRALMLLIAFAIVAPGCDSGPSYVDASELVRVEREKQESIAQKAMELGGTLDAMKRQKDRQQEYDEGKVIYDELIEQIYAQNEKIRAAIELRDSLAPRT